jgi:hypothetical protein
MLFGLLLILAAPVLGSSKKKSSGKKNKGPIQPIPETNPKAEAFKAENNPPAEINPSDQLTALEAFKNPQDNEIFRLYNFPALKPELVRFYGLLQKSHPRPENMPEAFLNLMTNYAHGIPCDRTEMFMTINYFWCYLEAKFSNKIASIKGFNLIYWMFLQKQTLNDPSLLQDMYNNMFPAYTMPDQEEDPVKLFLDLLSSKEPELKEIPTAFFMLAAAYKPALITEEYIKKLHLSGINPQFLNILKKSKPGMEVVANVKSNVKLNLNDENRDNQLNGELDNANLLQICKRMASDLDMVIRSLEAKEKT